MFFHKRTIPGLAIHTYMVGDEASKRCAVIDPVRDVDPYIEIAQKNQLEITDILETHVHADFVCGSVELKARLNGKPQIHCSGMGGDEWTPAYADHVVQDGDEIHLGKIRLRAVHTPGHTPEHLMWALYDEMRSSDTPWLYFTGDFLFVGSIGRPDLLGPEVMKVLAQQLYSSVFNIIPGMPDYAEIFPAHGAGSLCGKAIGSRDSSTVGYEREFNSSLEPASEKEWTDHLLEGMPPSPPYFARMKELNAKGPAVLGADYLDRPAVPPAEIAGALVVDVRSKEAFAAAHIPGSISLPLVPNFSTWAGWVLPPDQPLLLVLERPEHLEEAIKGLIRVGYDNIVGYLDGGIHAWMNQGGEMDRIGLIKVKDVSNEYIVDVRSDSEWKGGHIPGAHHIPFNKLQEIPQESPLALVCGSGLRATIAASVLKRRGYRQVNNILGGMSAWKGADLPLQVEENSGVKV